jgi:4-hydroxy-3-methylbut-2-enyl diphosphate reductase
MGRVVAIDGPSGAGKSTVAKAVAEALGYRYLDTGALYRAVGVGLVRAGLTEGATDDQVEDALGGMSVEFREGRAWLDGQDVEAEIRTPQAGHYSSVFSARAPVRAYLLPVQRDAAEHDNLVAEGRDMGTVVFPRAHHKFYIDAALDARARRRFLQLREKGIEATMEQAMRDVAERDERDTARDLAPLKQAEDAVYVDTAEVDASAVIRRIVDEVRERGDCLDCDDDAILLGQHAGFCFGVKRAVDMAFDVARKANGGIVTIGPIIHNPQVIERLGSAGVEAVDVDAALENESVHTVIVRTHGIPEADMQRLTDKGLEVIDATCPFVKKAQQYAKLLRDEGYRIVILGDREHPEVKGIVSYAGDDAIVVKDADEYPKVTGKVGIIVQTTKQVEALQALLARAVLYAKELKVYNTICNSTAQKLRETAELAGRVDVMIIVGGRNSANTTRLANLSASLGVPTYHIETADEVQDSWFAGAGLFGITAGASTPDWIIEEVKNRIKRIMHTGGDSADGNP